MATKKKMLQAAAGNAVGGAGGAGLDVEDVFSTYYDYPPVVAQWRTLHNIVLDMQPPEMNYMSWLVDIAVVRPDKLQVG